MTNEQLHELSREDLDQLQRNILAEQTRRDTLENTVATVKSLSDKYEQLGGSKTALVDAITSKPEDPTPPEDEEAQADYLPEDAGAGTIEDTNNDNQETNE